MLFSLGGYYMKIIKESKVRHANFSLAYRFVFFGLVLLQLSCIRHPTAPDPVSMTDPDGNAYRVIRIGRQLWTIENYRSTKYRDGSPIEFLSNISLWESGGAGYCFYNNTSNSDSISKFGALYNYHAVQTEKLAPSGWRIPNDTDWAYLESYLYNHGYSWDDTSGLKKIAKAVAANTDWAPSTTEGSIGCDLSLNNRSGFSALPGGYRSDDGSFHDFGSLGHWWAISVSHLPDSQDWYLGSIGFQFGREDRLHFCGLSIRLIKAE
jgi:uncharacterized protein (TIGR02145 family)